MAEPIYIPLLNPNEPQATLSALTVEEGQRVERGDILCELETTKSTSELTADLSGYIVALQRKQGDPVTAGEILCYIAESPEWEIPEVGVPLWLEEVDKPLPEGLRITQPALHLAQQANLDLERLPLGLLVTESLVRSYLGGRLAVETSAADRDEDETRFDPTAIIVYGGGGHGKSLVDLLRLLNVYRLHGIIDDGIPAGETVMGLPVLGGSDQLSKLHGDGVRLAVNAVGGIGNVGTRVEVFHRLRQAGFTCPSVVHPVAFVEQSASLAAGVQVFPHAYIGSEVRIGFGSIVNTSAVVSHECDLGEYTNISPGALLAGGVQVGERALVGMGATINLYVKIGEGARVGNGATIKTDVPPHAVVRAGSIWPE